METDSSLCFSLQYVLDLTGLHSEDLIFNGQKFWAGRFQVTGPVR